MTTNDLPLVRAVVAALQTEGLDVWISGGWAEELRNHRLRGAHTDIDVLLRATDFDRLEAAMRSRPGISEIHGKHFSHKRAFDWGGVVVEVLLVQPGPPDVSVMFDGRVVFQWPVDTFTTESVDGLPVVSTAALELYRRNHDQVARAYRAFRASPAELVPSAAD